MSFYGAAVGYNVIILQYIIITMSSIFRAERPDLTMTESAAELRDKCNPLPFFF